MKVNFIAKVIDNNKNTIGAYTLDLELPFTPMLGMELKGGTSTWLWETINGNELNPKIQKIVYQMDDEELYCLFEINEKLANSRWIEIKDIYNSYELHQFETH